jgi:nitrile hydratase accessory protein
LTLPDGAPHDTMLPESLRGRSDPAFTEPWQARAFALAVLASRQGCFSWPEWTHALGRELQRASQSDSQSEGRCYFDCWLRALQSLLVGKNAVAQGELSERQRAWEDAYRRTPHGLPVSLSAP